MAYTSWSFESGKDKKAIIIGKLRPYKQRQEERFETVEIKKYDESETNNNDKQN